MVLRSVSENDTVGIRTASGRTHTDGQFRPALVARVRVQQVTFEVSEQLLSPLRVDHQREVPRLFPGCELQAGVDVERQSPE